MMARENYNLERKMKEAVVSLEKGQPILEPIIDNCYISTT